MGNLGSKVVDAASLPSDSSDIKLGVGALTLLVVGSMIGSGIFSLPQTLSSASGPAGILVGWGISIFGMLMMVLVFRNLSRRRRDIGDGIYGYARIGFGHYMGFNAAWGHGVADAVGNGAYLVIIFSALGAFRPLAFFGEGNTLPSLIGSSLLLWFLTYLVLRGVRLSSLLNNITTVAKVLPLVVFGVVALFAFRGETFLTDVWGATRHVSLFGQVRGVMMITVWAFIGCESATIFASRARNLDDVAKASVLGFLIAALLMVAVSVLSLGILSPDEAATLHNPSLAGILEHIVGEWGGAMVNFCLILTVLGALLAWIMLCSEYIYLTGRGRIADPAIAVVNAHGAPKNALFLTSGITQLMVVMAYFYQAGYLALLSFATSLVLIPYLLTALFQVRIALGLSSGDTYFGDNARYRSKDLTIGILASSYCMWLIYAAGLKYLLLGMLLYLPGMVIFLRGQKYYGRPSFSRWERLVVVLIVAAALLAVAGMAQGWLTAN
jgi:arginine:ornithine antiporter/lysine permease